MAGSLFGSAGRELIECRDGPLDGETIFVHQPTPLELRVVVGPERRPEWVGPEKVPTVMCQYWQSAPAVRQVYVYRFCDHEHYHLEEVL